MRSHGDLNMEVVLRVRGNYMKVDRVTSPIFRISTRTQRENERRRLINRLIVNPKILCRI